MLTLEQERLLSALCQNVRIATANQAMAILHPERGDEDASRELSQLVAKDLLRRDRLLARLIQFENPLVVWTPGSTPPEMASIAWRARKRWNVQPEVVTVYRAGPVARRVFGQATANGVGNLNSLCHDLACTELLLTFLARRPERIADWVSEDRLKRDQEQGDKLPDVVLYAESGPYLVCEVIGVYPKARLSAFHDFVAGVLGLPYELW